MNDKPTINPQILPPLTKFIYTLGQLPSSYLMSMSFEEQLVWLCNYLATQVIPAVNQNGEAVQELQNLYELLQNYVNNYFDNLDVQEEINNKIDEMVESGELTQLIETYINPYIENQNLEIETFKTEVNNEISEQNTLISSVITGSPLVASSTSGMTDTSRLYVNTSNGYIYYYNGTQWVQGWLYQASQPSDEIAEIKKLIPKMLKDIQGANNAGTISITKDDTSITISKSRNNENYRFITSTHFLNWTQSMPNSYTFARSSLNYNAGAVAIVLTSTEIKLVQLNNTTSSELSDMDIIIGIITNLGKVFVCDCVSRLKYNNTIYNGAGMLNTNIEYIRNGELIINSSTNQIDVSINNTDSNVSLETKTYHVSTNYTSLNTTFLKTNYAYNLGVWGLIFDPLSFSLELYRLPNISDTQRFNNYYNYYIIIGYFINNGSEFVTNCKSNIKFNGKYINDNKRITDIENNLGYINKYDFMRCFKTFTGIGDSLMAGYTSVDGHTINSATARSEENNWFSYLLSRLNRTGTNLAIGSSTTHNWRYHDQAGGLDSNIENANIPTNCYFMGIGVNDERQSLTVGYETDINEDYTQNADSFYGNYDYCINRLKIFNPHAKIFCFTIPNSEENASNYNTAIRYICSLYDNVYCIDLNTLYDFSTGFIADNFTNGHYNPITYNYMSILIEKAINDYIYNNSTKFDLVPYDYN